MTQKAKPTTTTKAKAKPSLALFDFDGTITTKDSLIDFIQYAVGKPRYYFGLVVLSPVLVAFVLKLMPNHQAKEKMLGYFFGGWSHDELTKLGQSYALERIDLIVRPKAIQKIQWHQQQGHKVVMVSASMQIWLQKWCDKHDIELICTRLAHHNGKLTGKFDGPNCHGQEKINRIRAQFILSDYERVYAYGDSSGDTQMLAIADEGFYRHFE